ncbi:MAG: PTS IIA-like nitrogen regulatory protein PtsN [Alphaproteobacteria bacterium]|nr:PTS IIA-like nitrogen regulatory protein PtsN [Alphaproteobacteria bacterium]
MEIAELITPQSVIARLHVQNKRQLVAELAKRASVLTGLPERTIAEVLAERERAGSTGIGSGIAIPHGKLPELSRFYGIFARLERPIAFEAIDEEPVDLVFMLLTPQDAGAEHLKTLARVSRLLRDRTICDKLRGCDRAEGLYVLLTDLTGQPP